MKKYWWVLIAIALPQVVFAALPSITGPEGSALISTALFKPPVTDVSVSFLRQIFGTVGSVLHGTSGQIVGKLLGTFNAGILIIAGLFLTYSGLKSVVGTAQDGNPMGKKISASLPLRMVAGISAMLPMFTGYSFIQVAVMWVVLQGVGFADSAWNAALNYLQEGGTVYTMPTTNTVGGDIIDSYKQSIDQAAQIFTSQVCMYKIQKSADGKRTRAQEWLRNNATAKDDPSQSDYYASMRTLATRAVGLEPEFDPVTKMLYIPGKPKDKEDPPRGYCGMYSWKTAPITSPTGTVDYEPYKESGLRQMVQDLRVTAESFADENPQKPPTDIPIPDPSNPPNFGPRTNAFVTAAADYIGLLRPPRVMEAGQKNEEIAKVYDEAKKAGWSMAGRYYRAVALARGKQMVPNSNYLAEQKQSPPDLQPPVQKQYIENYVNYANAVAKAITAVDADRGDVQMMELKNLIGPDSGLYKGARKSLGDAGSAANAAAGLAKYGLSFGTVSGSEITDQISAMLSTVYAQWLKTMAPLEVNENAVSDPIAQLASLGMVMMEAPVQFWIQSSHKALSAMTKLAGTITGANIGIGVLTGAAYRMGAYTVSGALGSIGSSFSLMFQVAVIGLFWFLPLGVALATPIFVMGLTLGVYVPLIPFLLFTFGVIGWLILVIESMIAAPLVAFGLTHPEGHDLLGRSEQGVMLLLNLFLRPVCMVIGLILSIVMMFMMLRLMNMGFLGLAIDMVRQFQSAAAGFGAYADATVFIGIIGILVIYTSIMMTLIQQCASLIYLVADKITRWLGGHPEQSEFPGMLEQIKTGVSSAAQAAGQGAGQIASGARGLQGAQSGHFGGKGKEDEGVGGEAK